MFACLRAILLPSPRLRHLLISLVPNSAILSVFGTISTKLSELTRSVPFFFFDCADAIINFSSFRSLKKNEEDIPDAQALLQHPFITKYADDQLDLAEWIVQSLQKVGQYKP